MFVARFFTVLHCIILQCKSVIYNDLRCIILIQSCLKSEKTG